MTRDKRYLESLVPPKIKSEGYEIEWKASARWSLKEERIDKGLVEPILKAIVSFLNSKRPQGKILVGYNESRDDSEGFFCGIERDGFVFENGKLDRDKWSRFIIDSLVSATNSTTPSFVEIEFYEYSENITCALICVERTHNTLVEFSLNGINKIFYRSQHQNVPLNSQAEIEEYRNIRSTGRNYRGGWAINSIDGNLDNELMSLNWRDLGVVTERLRDDIPASPGLYIYTIENIGNTELPLFNGLKTIAYVGKAKKNIRQRYISHWKESDFVSCRKLYDNKFKFHYLEHEDEGLVSSWEKELINFFGPPINKKIG